ncbi:MAG: hypothetical protein IAX21_03825 [Candidatus Bathyarchaeota archaeon]|nr:MAG: hypothetical protein IAX21_03825 [Candidatus Bathyarchaeota archaeon]
MVKPSRLVYISYLDHLLFKNMNANICHPAIRETVGWIVKENSDAIWLQWDRNIENNLEKNVENESGLVILKSCIINRSFFSSFETTGEGLCRSLAQPSSTKNLKTKS